jgi:hypothetical protein
VLPEVVCDVTVVPALTQVPHGDEHGVVVSVVLLGVFRASDQMTPDCVVEFVVVAENV